MIGAHKIVIFTCAALLFCVASARAQITPFHGTLEYRAENHARPTVVLKAANGSRAYVLTLEPDSPRGHDVDHLDLVLQRPRARSDASNMLEPEYRWHGLQEYNFNAIDFVNGPENSIFGKTRHIHIRRRKLDVTFSIVTVKVRPLTEKPSDPDDYAFDELMIDVTVENAK